MANARDELNKLVGESLLLIRLGWQLFQGAERSSDSLSLSRWTHSAARLLLDWHYHATAVPDYKDRRLHTFASQWTPYRYGSILGQPESKMRIAHEKHLPLRRWFLEDLIAGDDFFPFLGVRVDGGSAGVPGPTKVAFEIMEPAYWEDVMDEYNLGLVDILLIDGLGGLYSQLTSREIVSIASCPTNRCTKASLHAEILLWHWDMESFFSLLRSFHARSSTGNRDAIVDRLRQAYGCASQVMQKVRMSEEIGKIRDTKLASIHGTGLPDRVRSTLEDQRSDSFAYEVEAGDVISSFTLLVISALQGRVANDIVKPTTVSNNITACLNTMQRIGLRKSDLDAVRDMCMRPSESLLGISYQMYGLYGGIQEYLKVLGVPYRFMPDWWDGVTAAKVL